MYYTFLEINLLILTPKNVNPQGRNKVTAPSFFASKKIVERINMLVCYKLCFFAAQNKKYKTRFLHLNKWVAVLTM